MVTETQLQVGSFKQHPKTFTDPTILSQRNGDTVLSKGKEMFADENCNEMWGR